MEHNTFFKTKGAYLEQWVNFYEAQLNPRAIHIVAVACISQDPDEPMLFDIPVDMVDTKKGTATLNIVSSAVGYRSFGEHGLAVALSFRGKPVEVLVPYGNIVFIGALDSGMQLQVAEKYSPVFLAPFKEVVDEPTDPKAESENADERVVSLFKKKH